MDSTRFFAYFDDLSYLYMSYQLDFFISHLTCLLMVMSYSFSLQQTIWLFFRDMIKGIVLAILIGPPIVAAIITIVQVLLSKAYTGKMQGSLCILGQTIIYSHI